jgi:hypothetical protein
MKLTKDSLKKLIKQVVKENKRPSMLLSEVEMDPDYGRIAAMFSSQSPDGGPRELAMMTSQNPRAQTAGTAEGNRSLLDSLKKDLDEEGYDYMEVGGRYGGPEESLFIINNGRKSLKHAVIYYGKKYEQQAVVVGEKIYRSKVDPSKPQVYYKWDMLYLEPEDASQPRWPEEKYVSVETRDMVVTGPTAQARSNYFSSAAGQKFYIPFFSGDPSEAEGPSQNLYPTDNPLSRTPSKPRSAK